LNDSEVYFWQFVKFYGALRDVPTALLECLKELRELWNARRRPSGKRGPFTGLNTLVSDGERLYALCLYPGGHRALLSRRPWGRMVFARRGRRLVVASEPLDGLPWRDLGEGQILVADRNGRVQTAPMGRSG